MILNETQSTVLYEIGTVPGSNAFSIANRLGRDPSGIGRVCAELRRQGLISATEKKNIKNAPVNELNLTLLGFPLVVEILIMSHTGRDDDPLPPDHNTRVASFLRSNEDLHEGISLFSEFFSLMTEENNTAHYSAYVLRPLWFAVGSYLEDYEFLRKHHPSKLLQTKEREYSVKVALSETLFFKLWEFIRIHSPSDIDMPNRTAKYKHRHFPRYRLIRAGRGNPKQVAKYKQEEEFFRGKVIPAFKKSEGWEWILNEFESRERAWNELKLLRSMI